MAQDTSDTPLEDAPVEALVDAYYEAAGGEDNVSLLAFVRRALAQQEALVVDRFLDRLEVIVLGNIEDKLSESPGAFAQAEAAAAATRAEFAAARELVAARL